MEQHPATTLNFYISAPRPCPYIEGQREVRLLTHLPHSRGAEVYTLLNQHGFRRSQTMAYRPHCPSCNACKAIRVLVPQFEWRPRFTRTLRRNADLTRTIKPAHATQEQFTLFTRYVQARHASGGMADMTALDFAAMIEETSVTTHIVEYRVRGVLMAAILVDTLPDGPSLVYSFYDVEQPQRGLGTYMVLDAITTARAQQHPYVYLGYWVENSPVMGYKSQFTPWEVVGNA